MIGVAAALACSLWADPAAAYAWMLRHGYTGCATCHLDPSGSGALTAYGRTIGELVLRTRYGAPAEEASAEAEFLFGAVPLPSEVLLGGDVRLLLLSGKAERTPVQQRAFLMQADFEAALCIGRFTAAGSIGYGDEAGFGAAITRAPENNLVSRQHWLGLELDRQTGLVLRGGRLNVPFGIRNVEHTLWARALTESSINDDQQHGLALAVTSDPWRGEVMLIAGNLQLRPDAYRERGASGFVEWFPSDRLGLGASGLSTHRELDPSFLRETWRHQAGVFARWAPGWQPLLVMAEADYVLRSPKQDQRREGVVAYLQLDLEPFQGFHLVGTGELHGVGVDTPPLSWGAWISELWFFAPHADLRLDGIYYSLATELDRIESFTLLLQAHVYL